MCQTCYCTTNEALPYSHTSGQAIRQGGGRCPEDAQDQTWQCIYRRVHGLPHEVARSIRYSRPDVTYHNETIRREDHQHAWCATLTFIRPWTSLHLQVFLGINSMLDVKKFNTTAYHHQTVGLVEPFNRTFTDMMAKKLGNRDKD